MEGTLAAGATATVAGEKFLHDELAKATSMNPEIIFGAPPQNLKLLNGEAHVFCAALDLPPARQKRFEEFLSSDERARAARFVFTRDRDRFVAGRGMLREILGRLLRADPKQLIFAHGRRGKPRLAAPVAGRFLHFNLAHSDALAVYIVSAQGEVGIDVERIRPVREAAAIAARFFSEREQARWRFAPAGRQTEAFFEGWTRQESLLKAAGHGLGEPPDQTRLPSPDHMGRLNSVEAEFSKYNIHLLTPVPGYQAAAATRSARAPACWKWPAS